MIGRTLSHYTLVSELGRGGMGVVYRARDVTLGREVALKVLPREFVADPERRRRFIQEAKSAAALEHPHIGVVYEVGEADGITFIAMQLIRGEPLRDILHRGSLPAGRAVELAREVAEGLSTAHDKGIVHRDLTSANIIVTDEGHAKIIDFGLAKLVERLSDATSEAETQLRTEAGVVMGTTSYMSPEQARGQEADHRSDVFTLGIVLYQMLSGETPFKRTSAVETMNAIITAPDPAVKLASETDASSELRRIVHKCLAKNPRDRYQTMKDLVVDLREVGRRLESGSPSPAVVARTPPSSRRLWVAAVLAAVALAGIAGYMLNRPQRQSTESITGERKRIAILQFQNLGAADDEYFAAGVTEEISSRLAGVSQLAVISRNSLRRYANTEKTSQQVGRELGVDFILQGTVRWQPAKDGPGRVRVTPQLVRVADDTQMWAETYERQLDEIFAVQSDIASRVSQQLGAVVLAAERKLIDTTPTANLDAYKEYLRGNFLYFHRARQQDRMDALPFFERAVELDPGFAKGHAGVAIAAAWRFFYVSPVAEWEARAGAAIETALKLDPNLADAYLARGNLLWTQPRGFPHERAIREYRRALALNPNLAEARVALGRLYNHVGLLDEARNELTVALQLDPSNEEAPGRIVGTYTYQHDHVRALAEYERLSDRSNWSKVIELSYLGRDREARAMAATLAPDPWVPDLADFASTQFPVVLLARNGQREQVDAVLPQLEAFARNPQGLSHVHHVQYNLGLTHALFGRKREAIMWLRKAAAEGLPCYPFFVKDPNLASLAGDPDFETFMTELKAQQERLRAVAHAPIP
jgi:serine/threonine protein kinase/tetratricopeptide (TPR) repeat protein